MKGETPQTPREEIEVRVTALLLGELPPEQAAALEAQIAADPELKSLHARLREAITLVREASTIREQPTPATLARLSNERRERLLKYFKSEVPSVVQPRRKRDWSWVRPLSLAAGLIALIGGGLFLDRSRRPSVSTADGVVIFDAEEISGELQSGGTRRLARGDDLYASTSEWDSQPGSAGVPARENPGDSTKRLYVLRDGSMGPASRASERNPIVGSTTFWNDDASVKYAEASPANATDRFGTSLKSEAKRPWYLAWGGQAASSNSPGSDGGRGEPSTEVRAHIVPVPLAAAPAPPASAPAAPAPTASAPMPALEPAPGPPGESAPTTRPFLAGIEPSRPAAAGGAGLAGRSESEAVASARGALQQRSLNESQSDFSVEFDTKTAPLGEQPKVTPFFSQPASGGVATKPAQTPFGGFGREPALNPPDSPPTTDMSADGRTETFGFAVPRDNAQGAQKETQLGLQWAAPASGTLTLNRGGVSAEKAGVAGNAFGDFGTTAESRSEVRHDGLDALARNKDGYAEGWRTGKTPYYRGRAIEESGLKEQAGAKVEEHFDASSRVEQLSKNFVDLNTPKALDESARFYQKQTLANAVDATHEMTVNGKAAGLDKKTDEAQRTTSNRTLEVAKLADTKALPAQREKAIEQLKEVEDLVTAVPERMPQIKQKLAEVDGDVGAPQPRLPAPVPQPEVVARENRFSTFSLNVSDVSFKLAAASLESGTMPDPAAIRSEEFINALDYRDPEPARGLPLAFASERARYPFAQNRDLLRISVKTAAAGRQTGRPLNVVLLVDNSGSMERADRVRILHEALRILAGQLQPQDKLSIITFARTPRLWIDGVAGDKAGEATARVSEITPQGGTNLAAALDLGYQTALRHYNVQSINRVVLLTDGAANLGNVNAAVLKEKVEAHRKQGVALDCFGIGWEGYNDDLLEVLSRNGDGRYGFINSAEEAATVFAAQLAGALRVAASDVKVQVEFNPRRVTAYRQVGYAKHQLTKEQFRDNTVDAAEIGAAEAGNGIYLVEVNPRGEGDLATVRVRFKVPGTATYREHEWSVPFTPNVPPLEQATVAMRLAGSASAFSEWLAGSPYAGEITTDALLGLINGVPGAYGADPRPKKLEWMIRQAKSLSGR